MNRNVIVTVVVVLLIAGASAYLYMNRDRQQPAMTEQESASSAPSPTVSTKKTTLKNFMNMSQTQKCEFSDTDSKSTGEVFVDSGKVRADFTTEVNGALTPSHMINDGSSIYIWMDNQTTGFKTSLDDIEKMNSQADATTGVAKTVDLEQEVDYKCESWSPDAAKFEVPANIKFNDAGKMMEDAINRMPKSEPTSSEGIEAKAAACKACDNLEGDGQAQCKRALKCS